MPIPKGDWASPVIYISFNQQILCTAAGSAVFFVVGPAVVGVAGTYFACSTIVCAAGTSAITGAVSGATAAAVGGGLSSYFVETNSRKWLKHNAGKKFINSVGKVEIVKGLAFIHLSGKITPLIGAINVFNSVPTWALYSAPLIFFFTANYLKEKRRIEKINKYSS
jgi:hypothetical protein